jgi:hypothetical protein
LRVKDCELPLLLLPEQNTGVFILCNLKDSLFPILYFKINFLILYLETWLACVLRNLDHFIYADFKIKLKTYIYIYIYIHFQIKKYFKKIIIITIPNKITNTIIVC